MNQFIRASQSKDTQTENGAVSNSTTGSELVDQFGKAGSYRGRFINIVFLDQAKLVNSAGRIWSLRFVLYLRIISRVIDFFGQWKTESVQRGQGAKDEAIKRFLWYASAMPDVFKQYLPLFVACGSFRDLQLMYRIVGMNKSVFHPDTLSTIVKFYTEHIIANNAMALKYMPLVQSNKKCTTPEAMMRNHFARDIRNELGINDREMRVLKSGGTGHVWQKLISQKRYAEISFNHIPGRALFLMATSKFLTNQKLREKYTAWLSTKPTAKFTGFVFELARKISYDQVIRQTINKQFKGLLETVDKTNRNWIVALDTSESMTAQVKGLNGTSAIFIAKSLAVYFANLLNGAFHKTFIQFAVKSNLRTLKSEDFCDQFAETTGGVGCTNFQSAIDCIVDIRRTNNTIPLNDYPNGLIVVSDMQFDPSQGYVSGVDNQNGYRGSYQSWIKPAQTNYETAMQKLRQVFPSEWVDDFKIVWWDCTARCADFPSVNEDSGTICISGFDGAVISNLFGMEQNTPEQKENNVKPTMEDIVKNTLSQEILLLVE